MSPIEEYYLKLSDVQRQVAFHLREVILAASPKMVEKLAWKTAFFYHHSYLCYFNTEKNGGLYIGFTRGHLLSNDQGILQMNGRKQIASVHYAELNDIHEEPLQEILQEAILVDEEWMRNKKRKR